MQKLLSNKPLAILLIVIILIVIYSVLNKEETIRIQPSQAHYTGNWRALHNSSQATVSIRDGESYDIRYSNAACKIVFVGSIYTIDIEAHLFEILKLDIDHYQSQCYFLNALFAPSKFVFKLEAMTPEYAKLQLPSANDLEQYLEYAEGSDTVKNNLASMIKMLKSKSAMLQKIEQIVLEYEKK